MKENPNNDENDIVEMMQVKQDTWVSSSDIREETVSVRVTNPWSSRGDNEIAETGSGCLMEKN